MSKAIRMSKKNNHLLNAAVNSLECALLMRDEEDIMTIHRINEARRELSELLQTDLWLTRREREVSES